MAALYLSQCHGLLRQPTDLGFGVILTEGIYTRKGSPAAAISSRRGISKMPAGVVDAPCLVTSRDVSRRKREIESLGGGGRFDEMRSNQQSLAD